MYVDIAKDVEKKIDAWNYYLEKLLPRVKNLKRLLETRMWN